MKPITTIILICITVSGLLAQTKSNFVTEVYQELDNIDLTLLPYISKELIIGSEFDSTNLKKLKAYIQKIEDRTESERKFSSLLMCALGENTRRLFEAQLKSDPFPDYYNTKGYSLLIVLSNNYNTINLNDSTMNILLYQPDATILNYYDQVYSALFCVHTSKFLSYMEINMLKFKPYIKESYLKWLKNPNPIFKHEKMMEPVVNYDQLIKCVALCYDRIGNEYKNEEFKRIIKEQFIGRLK